MTLLLFIPLALVGFAMLVTGFVVTVDGVQRNFEGEMAGGMMAMVFGALVAGGCLEKIL